jgi:hypothetical protein
MPNLRFSLLFGFLAGCGGATNQTGGNHVVTFVDLFQRQNTLPGSLGIATDGKRYAMYGAYINGFPLPQATDGEVRNKLFVSTRDETVIYATKNFGLPICHISSTFQWDITSSHASTQSGAMIISPNANLIEAMIHITFNSHEVLLQKRSLTASGDSFVTLIAVPVSQLDGKPHAISLDVVGTTGWLTIDGVTYSCSDPELVSLVGPYAAWEIYSATPDVYRIQFAGVAASSVVGSSGSS